MLLFLYNSAVFGRICFDGCGREYYFYDMKTHGIIDTLIGKSRAKMEGFVAIGNKFALAKWRNGFDRVKYIGTNHHTLSIYQSGYHNADRT